MSSKRGVEKKGASKEGNVEKKPLAERLSKAADTEKQLKEDKTCASRCIHTHTERRSR